MLVAERNERLQQLGDVVRLGAGEALRYVGGRHRFLAGPCARR
jgi:hypothetical protein